jgi:hypothetical protein
MKQNIKKQIRCKDKVRNCSYTDKNYKYKLENLMRHNQHSQ